jgi:hypothetical protein
MQTLIFNTTLKTVKVLSNYRHTGDVVESFENIPTVKCSELGFYEVMQKMDTESLGVVPVMRLPISNTNMIIVK